ncbi:MAG: hypothetical protein N3A69_03645, partial [Leptospiraceae bacterium]|nr:hypothetical protein [Leptospiraceae bacterium]
MCIRDSPGKVREIADLLADLSLEIHSQGDYGVPAAEETGLSFVEKSKKEKSLKIFRLFL